jgi:hypothetical protein
MHQLRRGSPPAGRHAVPPVDRAIDLEIPVVYEVVRHSTAGEALAIVRLELESPLACDVPEMRGHSSQAVSTTRDFHHYLGRAPNRTGDLRHLFWRETLGPAGSATSVTHQVKRWLAIAADMKWMSRH